jgi:steroid 5-alpha reductase family enzyme
MSDIFEMCGASFIIVLSLMTLLWVIYYFVGHSSIVDLGWSLGFVFAVWADFILGDGNFWKKGVLTLMVSLWGLRLAFHLFQRVKSTQDDLRYVKIKEKWGPDNQQLKFLGMFLFQGMLVVILTIPFIVVCHNSDPVWHLSEVVGIVFWLIGLWGETAADWQLRQFKNGGMSNGKVLQDGLWRYSRHPNYFFEFIIWIGFFIFSWQAPGGALAIISPLLILFLLTNVSGIPLAEEMSLSSKGDDYREYQRTTSAFIPWFRKK